MYWTYLQKCLVCCPSFFQKATVSDRFSGSELFSVTLWSIFVLKAGLKDKCWTLKMAIIDSLRLMDYEHD